MVGECLSAFGLVLGLCKSILVLGVFIVLSRFIVFVLLDVGYWCCGQGDGFCCGLLLLVWWCRLVVAGLVSGFLGFWFWI